MITVFFDIRNHNKSISRLGEKDHGTYQVEKLLNLNSYAKEVGFTTLPYSDVTAPSMSPGSPKEHMGFTYRLDIPADLSNPTDALLANGTDSTAPDDDEIDEDGGDDSSDAWELGRDPNFESILQEACADLDIEVVFTEEEYEEAQRATRVWTLTWQRN